MDNQVKEQQAQKALESGYAEAEIIINSEDKTERLLQRLEKKMKVVPLIGDKLANIPIMVSLVRSYAKKEYTDVPIGTVIAIVSALVYFVSPIDVVPDSIPFFGYFDDAAVVAACWKLVESDVKEYVIWREENGKEIDLAH